MKLVILITATIITASASVSFADSDCLSRSNVGRFASTNPAPKQAKAKTVQTQTNSVRSAR